MSDELSFSQCQDCQLLWEDGELKEVKDLFERVQPGEPMPSGECPECKAVCQPHEGDYLDRCPTCAEPIKLVGFSARCDLYISPSGWALSYAKTMDTSSEVFHCVDCDIEVPSMWVFGHSSRAKAVKRMEELNAEKKK